jgi:hypothetical protein
MNARSPRILGTGTNSNNKNESYFNEKGSRNEVIKYN